MVSVTFKYYLRIKLIALYVFLFKCPLTFFLINKYPIFIVFHYLQKMIDMM